MVGSKFPYIDTVDFYLDDSGSAKAVVTTLGGSLSSVDLVVDGDIISTASYKDGHLVYTDANDVHDDYGHYGLAVYYFKALVKLLDH